jgi:L-asparaginase
VLAGSVLFARAFSAFCRPAALFALLGLLTAVQAADAGIAVIHSTKWSPGDCVRDGAGEFQVLVSVASLQREHSTVGVVGVGNRHGLFPAASEHALRFFALHGVPVAKLAKGDELVPDPEGLFLDGGALSEKEAADVLAHCLNRYGAPPLAANPDRPTANELEAIRKSLRPFRAAFAVANAKSGAVASR